MLEAGGEGDTGSTCETPGFCFNFSVFSGKLSSPHAFIQSCGIFRFSFLGCGNSRSWILVMKTFFTVMLLCLLSGLFRSSWVFSSFRSRGSSVSLKTPTLPDLLLQFPCSFDFCVTQILVLCLFMPSRFLI